MSWYKLSQLAQEVIDKYNTLIKEFLSLPQTKEWGYEQMLTDQNKAVGACGSVSKDLSDFFRQKRIAAHVVGCTGFIPNLPEDAHPEWRNFVSDDYENQKYLWHAVVETDDAVIDLTGGQYGKVFSGVQIKPKQEYLNDWRKHAPHGNL